MSQAEGWDRSVAAWAASRPDIKALVQIGSRVQAGSSPDEWSDYDYHLVTSAPHRYRDGTFASELGRPWACGSQVAFGGAVKVTAVFEGALEADFVVLSNWEVRVAFMALSSPFLGRLSPAVLRSGILNLRIVAAPGWRVIKGGAAWERRYRRIAPASVPMAQAEFLALCGEFWTQLVWAAKKAERGEFRAARRAVHVHLLSNAMRIFQEEALLGGRTAYPLGRRAEQWLGPGELSGTGFTDGPDRASLLAAMARLAGAFDASSGSLARTNSWSAPNATEVRSWLSGLAGGGPGALRS
ncbi:MAG TPA: aminoglycoside 6-adenylyltransferase [Opitutaceae bacterium]|jgi:hypothetical protein